MNITDYFFIPLKHLNLYEGTIEVDKINWRVKRGHIDSANQFVIYTIYDNNQNLEGMEVHYKGEVIYKGNPVNLVTEDGTIVFVPSTKTTNFKPIFNKELTKNDIYNYIYSL